MINEKIVKKFLKTLKQGPGLLNYEAGTVHLSRYVHGGVFTHPVDLVTHSIMCDREITHNMIEDFLKNPNMRIVSCERHHKNRDLFSAATFLTETGVFGIKHEKINLSVHSTVFIEEVSSKVLAVDKVPKAIKITASNYGISYSRLNDVRSTKEEFYPYLDMGKLRGYVHNSNNGIVILSGEPGTGKSRLIEHLLQDKKKSVFFADASASKEILTPSVLDELKGSIVVIEEGDNLIADRKDNPMFNPAFLDATSGLTGETYGITFVVTTNLTLDKLDNAIKRKGRLIYNQEFRALSGKEVEKLNELGITSVCDIKHSMSLADIFSEEDNTNVAQKPKRSVGFT